MKRRPFIKQILTASGGIILSSKLSALTLTNKNPKRLGIALVGLGNYSEKILGPALLETKHCYLAGIVTGTPEKEDIWKKKYNLKNQNIYTYDNFDSISKNDEIDIIYVVLPNSMHAEYTIRAAKAGKHVICEKPMAISVSECRKMIEACNIAGKKLAIGYRLHYDPFNSEMMRLGQNKVYGKTMNSSANFSFTLKNASRWRTKKDMAGGGPLMDLGIYCIQASIYTFGELPNSLWARNITKDISFFKDIEGTIEWEMSFPSGKAYGKTSYEDTFTSFLTVETETGKFGLNPAFNYNGLKGYTPDGYMNFKPVNQQALQMDAFSLDVINNRNSLVPGEMGMRDNYLIEKIYQSAENDSKTVSLDDIPKILDLRNI